MPRRIERDREVAARQFPRDRNVGRLLKSGLEWTLKNGRGGRNRADQQRPALLVKYACWSLAERLNLNDSMPGRSSSVTPAVTPKLSRILWNTTGLRSSVMASGVQQPSSLTC